VIGLIYFFMGFIFVSLKKDFWFAAQRNRWYALSLAVLLYLVRLFIYNLEAQLDWLTALESFGWMMAVIGFTAKYLNQSSRSLSYFSKAVYPVYIVHLPVQFILAYYLLTLELPAVGKLALMLTGTFGICLLLYEFILKRIKWIRPMFGMKLNSKK